tara:strand:+ start:3021 stop:3131 length:111 start_codon:yes stop_codon:yes gene_type:complete
MTYLESGDFIIGILCMWGGLVIVHQIISRLEKKGKK